MAHFSDNHQVSLVDTLFKLTTEDLKLILENYNRHYCNVNMDCMNLIHTYYQNLTLFHQKAFSLHLYKLFQHDMRPFFNDGSWIDLEDEIDDGQRIKISCSYDAEVTDCRHIQLSILFGYRTRHSWRDVTFTNDDGTSFAIRMSYDIFIKYGAFYEDNIDPNDITVDPASIRYFRYRGCFDINSETKCYKIGVNLQMYQQKVMGRFNVKIHAGFKQILNQYNHKPPFNDLPTIKYHPNKPKI